jgi:HAD superfamily hydrolase (TIGR01484 family)
MAGNAGRTRRMLFAYDIDGTILGAGSVQPSERTLRALRAASEAGCYIALVSGRGRADVSAKCREWISEDAFAICCNGAVIADGRGSRLTEIGKTISPEDFLLLGRELSKEDGDAFFGYTDDGVLVCPHAGPRETEDARTFGGRIAVASKPEDFKGLAVIKAVAFCRRRPQSELPLRRRLTYVPCNGEGYEINARGVDKGAGTDALRKMLGLRRNDVVCFGNGGNDAPMLRRFRSFAPADAWPEAKEAAGETLQETCDEDAAAIQTERELAALKAERRSQR